MCPEIRVNPYQFRTNHLEILANFMNIIFKRFLLKRISALCIPWTDLCNSRGVSCKGYDVSCKAVTEQAYSMHQVLHVTWDILYFTYNCTVSSFAVRPTTSLVVTARTLSGWRPRSLRRNPTRSQSPTRAPAPTSTSWGTAMLGGNPPAPSRSAHSTSREQTFLSGQCLAWD